MRKPETKIKKLDNESSILRKELMSKTESQRLFLSIPMAPKRSDQPPRRYVE
jgi:hypothetical protein